MIAESQLATWTTQGASTSASATYASILAALRGRLPIPDTSFEVYLQGSYRNDTNVRGDSDVDVVAQLQTTFTFDLEQMLPSDRASWLASRPPGTYGWDAFRADVVAALASYYGSALVTERPKCVSVTGTSGRLNADVLVSLTHRRYRISGDYDEGVSFLAGSPRARIVNYPKQTYDHGVEKNGLTRTSGNYKPAVRMFKNARSAAVDRGLLRPEDAPSYFLQCLLYNAADASFRRPRWTDIWFGVIQSLLARIQSGPELISQNEITPLFGTGPDQWSRDSAVRTIDGLLDLWKSS